MVDLRVYACHNGAYDKAIKKERRASYMDPNISTFYLTQGVLGVTVVMLVFVVIKLYNKSEEKQLRIEELQDLRLQDSKEVTKDVTAVLQGNSQSNLILAEKIDSAKRRGGK